MAIVQISKIQVRTGAESDLPQLDIGELGFATDSKNAFIGNDPLLDPPVGIQPTLTQILTDSPNCHINASQITGVLNIQVSDIKIQGGRNGYVLKTDGAGNLSWGAGTGGGGGGDISHSLDTQVLFNSGDVIYGDSNFLYNISTSELTVTGNIIATNLAGNLTTGVQTNITRVGTLVNLEVTGNVISGNANLGNLAISNYFSGNGSLLTGVTATTAGTVTASSQPNITSIGTLSSLTVSGGVANIGTVGNVKIAGGTNGQILTTDGSGNLSWTTVSGGASTYGDSDVVAKLLTYLPTYPGILGGTATNATYAVNAGNAGNVAGSNVSGQVGNALVAGTVYTSAQPNITSIGTLSSLTVNGNIGAGNITVGNVSAAYISGNGSQLTSIAGARVTGVVANATYAVSAGSAGSATTTTWSGISGTPTTVSGYNITDAYGPAFIATMTSSTGLSTTNGIAEVALLYNNVIKNVGNGYTSGNGSFTAPRAGFYHVSATVSVLPSNWSQVNNYISAGAITLSKNNTKIDTGNLLGMVTQTINGQIIQAMDASSVSTLVYLDVNDKLSCSFDYATNAPNGFWNLLSLIPGTFQACWIRP